MRLKKRDLPVKPKPEQPSPSAPREVGRRVEAIVQQIKTQLEKMPGRAPATYEFEVVRDDRGYIKKIIARPVPAKSMN